MTNAHNKAFTLIELSVVLIIIGLLAGGVVVGQSLIEGSRLNALATEKGQLVSATKLFQDKYYSLPGDFKQAAALWGAMSTPVFDSITDGTFNGDGDGAVDINSFEEPLFWHHLALAGLMPYSYTGLVALGDAPMEVGRSLPKSQWKEDAGWHVRYVGLIDSEVTFFDGNYGHVFRLVGSAPTAFFTKTMIPDQLQVLDKKFDDGEVDTGKIRSFKPVGGNNCASGTNYNLALDTVECVPIWITGF